MKTRVIRVEFKRKDGMLEAFGLSDKAIATFDANGKCINFNWQDSSIYTQSTSECKAWPIQEAFEIIRYLTQIGIDQPESRITYVW